MNLGPYLDFLGIALPAFGRIL